MPDFSFGIDHLLISCVKNEKLSIDFEDFEDFKQISMDLFLVDLVKICYGNHRV